MTSAIALVVFTLGWGAEPSAAGVVVPSLNGEEDWAHWFRPEQQKPVPEGPAPAACWGWVRGDFLMWGVKKGPLDVPLVVDLQRGSSRLGSVVLGENDFNFGPMAGLRLQAGCRLDPDAFLEIEAVLTLLEQGGQNHAVKSDEFGFPALARPFINAATGAALLAPVSVPGILAGRVEASATTQFDAEELNLSCLMCVGGGAWLRGLVGFRHQGLWERLDVTQTGRALPGAVLVPLGGNAAEFQVRDSVRASNHFYGPQVGLRAGCEAGSCFASAWVKGGLGVTDQSLLLGGSTSGFPNVVPGPVPLLIPAVRSVETGLLVGQHNSGERSQVRLSAVGEFGVEAGFWLCSGIRAQAGYSFLYWTGVTRPGQQLSTTIDANSLVPGILGGAPVPLPGVPFRQTDFFAHGLNLGVTVEF